MQVEDFLKQIESIERFTAKSRSRNYFYHCTSGLEHLEQYLRNSAFVKAKPYSILDFCCICATDFEGMIFYKEPTHWGCLC